jgi:hypothetical protein
MANKQGRFYEEMWSIWVILFTLFSCILTLSADPEDQSVRIYRKSSLPQEGIRNLIVSSAFDDIDHLSINH